MKSNRNIFSQSNLILRKGSLDSKSGENSRDKYFFKTWPDKSERDYLSRPAQVLHRVPAHAHLRARDGGQSEARNQVT